jgi:osmoprotectant transport system permease protein
VSEVLYLSLQHLYLSICALAIGCAVGLPLAILLSRARHAAPAALALAAAVETVPSIALLGLLMLLPVVGGVGPRPAIAALALYSLMAIVDNSYTGIVSVDRALVDAGRGLGMTELQLLRFVELPQALPAIFAGVRISAVLCIATATAASYIGAGGLGDLVFRGVARGDGAMVMRGALPAIAMSLAAQFGLVRVERRLSRWSKPS